MKSFTGSTVTVRLIFLIAYIICAHGSNAQKPQGSFRLLWYQGKRINDTTLLKTNGEKVTYSPSRAMVSVTYPAGKDPHSHFRNDVGKNDQMRQQMDRMVLGEEGSLKPPGLVVAANDGFDEAVDEMMKILDNRFPLEPPALQATMQEKTIRFKNWPPEISADYTAVMEYIRRPDGGISGQLVPPPSFSFDYCFPCDAERREAYTRDSIAFVNSFLAEEMLNMNRATTVLAYLQKQKIKPGPDSLFSLEIRTHMYEAVVNIAGRIENKLISVWLTFKSDPAKVPFLVQLLLHSSHVHNLMGFETAKGYPNDGELAEALLAAVRNVLRKAKEERDYRVLLNVTRVTYLLKSAQCIGLPVEELTSGMEDYLKWNQFKITLDADAKMEMQDASQMATLHFEGPFIAYPDSTCKLKWYPEGMDSAKGIVFDLKEVALNTSQGAATYTGTRKFAAKRPWIKLDFCDEERDSALFYPFFPYGGMDTWDMGDAKNVPLNIVHTVFMTGFTDAAGLKKRAMSMNSASLEQQMNSVYKQKVAPVMGGLNMDPSTMTSKDYERAAKLMDAADEVIHITWYTSLYNFPLKGRLRNHQQLVFDETLDGKQISMFPNLAYATFKAKIEHIEQ